MKKSLTLNQLAVYEYLVRFVVSNHRQPTFREMMRDMGWASLNTPRNYLKILAEKGWLKETTDEKNFHTWKFADVRLKMEPCES